MSYRTFIDSDGVEWQAWDVMPQAAERRIGNRRGAREQLAFRDRRQVERRQRQGRWSPLTSGLSEGWLCFDSGEVRRRLTPIPPDWEECAVDALERYCRSANPARRSSPVARSA